MDDLTIAAIILTLLVSLALAAPLWGVDSRDGLDSDEPMRRVRWLYDDRDST